MENVGTEERKEKNSDQRKDREQPRPARIFLIYLARPQYTQNTIQHVASAIPRRLCLWCATQSRNLEGCMKMHFCLGVNICTFKIRRKRTRGSRCLP